MRALRRRPVLAVLVCCAATAAALAATWPRSASRAAVRTPVLRVTEKDFSVRAPKRAAAGEVRLVVENEGPESHELLVVRRRPGLLPFRRDRLTVDEDRLEAERILLGALEPARAGSVRELKLRLAPGRYELFCNMTGHYLGGMHAFLDVR